MFYGFVITESGNALLASMVAGQTMTITKAVVGEGTADNPDAARKLTDLITPGPTATSTRPTVDGNSVNMIVEYRSDLNGGLKEGFWIGEFGIFGKVGDGEEAMIGYGSLGDAKQYVSAYVEGTAPDVRRYPVSITVTTGVQVNVDYPAEAWMTAEDVDDKVNKHNSSEKSHQDIRASLSNKVSVPQPILPGTDLNVVTTPGMYYSENASDTGIQNAPNNDAAFSLLVENTGAWGGRARKQTYTPYNKNIVLTRILTFSGAGLDQIWTPWVQIAAATSQQEYDLLLENGIENNANTKSVYFVDPFGVVTVSVNVHGTNTLSAGTIIARIPEGFRPKRPNTVCVNTNAFLSFDPSGNIIVYTVDSKPLDANKWLVANVSFLAAGN